MIPHHVADSVVFQPVWMLKNQDLGPSACVAWRQGRCHGILRLLLCVVPCYICVCSSGCKNNVEI
jgi:hypothetical protein